IVESNILRGGGFAGNRSRASSKHLSPHLPVGELDSSGVKQGCAAPEAACGRGIQRKPDVDVFEKVTLQLSPSYRTFPLRKV
ncbi:hypothetical protein TNCV_59931, partial [Trichonephila clavipes]